jgi:hypothetical protein
MSRSLDDAGELADRRSTLRQFGDVTGRARVVVADTRRSHDE